MKVCNRILILMLAVALLWLGMGCEVQTRPSPTDSIIRIQGSGKETEAGKPMALLRRIEMNKAIKPTAAPPTGPFDLAMPNVVVIPLVDAQFVTWNPVEGADGYIIYRFRDAVPPIIQAAGIGPYNAVGFIDSQPPPEMSYIVVPYRGNAGSDPVPSKPLRATTQPVAVPRPIPSAAATRKNGDPGARVEVSWGAAPGAVGYHVQIAYEILGGWYFWDQRDVGLTLKAHFLVPNQQGAMINVIPFNAAQLSGPETGWFLPTGDGPLP